MTIKHTISAESAYYFTLDYYSGQTTTIPPQEWGALSAKEQSLYEATTLEIEEADLRSTYDSCAKSTEILNKTFGLDVPAPTKQHAYNLVAKASYQSKFI